MAKTSAMAQKAKHDFDLTQQVEKPGLLGKSV